MVTSNLIKADEGDANIDHTGQFVDPLPDLLIVFVRSGFNDNCNVAIGHLPNLDRSVGS